MKSNQLTANTEDFTVVADNYDISIAVDELIQKIKHWRVRSRKRQAVGKLEPHLLNDIGLNVAQAKEVASMPFWKN